MNEGNETASCISQTNGQSPSLICGIPNPFDKKVRAQENDAIENYLAASMNKLSVQDREKILEEVHGVAKADPEEETTVAVKLLRLEAHLSSRKRGTAYERAEQADPYYTSKRDFRIMFLRCNDYDPIAAAEQILRFFDMKQSLFGEEMMTHQITLENLDDNVKQCLQAGYTHFLEQKDAVKRQILLFLPGLKLVDADVETEARTLFYFCLTALESIETQKRGFIAILYAIGEYKDKKKGKGAARLGALANALPLRFASIHICCSDPVEYVMNQAAIRMLPTLTAAKIRIHLGSHLECQYALKSYGIPSGSFPFLSSDYSPDLTSHKTWFQQRIKMESEWTNDAQQPTQALECSMKDDDDDKLIVDEKAEDGDGNDQNESRRSSVSASSVAIQPQPTDVLFGRGFMMHPGNIQMRQMVTDNCQEYELACGKHQKIQAAGRLVDQMKSNGIRFLVSEKGQWTTATNAQARNKVAKTIRNRRRAKASST